MLHSERNIQYQKVVFSEEVLFHIVREKENGLAQVLLVTSNTELSATVHTLKKQLTLISDET